MVQAIHNEAQQRMEKSIGSLQAELAKIRTGRAHPSLLEHVMVEYYGQATPLSQTASVNVLDSRTLSVTPYDKSQVNIIEKAILTAELGLNPASMGDSIRIPLPVLTEERRKELVKVVKGEVEKARVAVRNIRRDANTQLKDQLKQKAISEDEEHRAQDNIQQLTDRFIADIDKIFTEKEADLLAL